tara:strand:- start:522 stop:1139 length:618 start_codon:yes stop_codon:yes gene_type:complete
MIQTDQLILIIFNLFLGYLLGSIPSGYLAGIWYARKDLRTIGSGSTGTTNVLRHVGKNAAVCVFAVDVLKGLLPILIARGFGLQDSLQVLAGIMALTGHIWPVWINWKGGKAVATGLGMFLGISWPVGLVCLGIFLTSLLTTRIVSLSSILSAISLPIIMFISFKENNFSYPYLLISIISMSMVVWRHRTNIERLIKGTEPKIGN